MKIGLIGVVALALLASAGCGGGQSAADKAKADLVAANQRVDRDDYVPARRAWGAKYSAELLDIVDWCLRLDHLERPQSVLALQKTVSAQEAGLNRLLALKD